MKFHLWKKHSKRREFFNRRGEMLKIWFHSWKKHSKRLNFFNFDTFKKFLRYQDFYQSFPVDEKKIFSKTSKGSNWCCKHVFGSDQAEPWWFYFWNDELELLERTGETPVPVVWNFTKFCFEWQKRRLVV